MTQTDNISTLIETNELDELQKRFESKKLLEEDEKDTSTEEKEPKSSKSTPEGTRSQQMTVDGRRVVLVAAKSKAKPVAGALAGMVRNEEEKLPVLSAVGAASVNQAVKAIAIARNYVLRDEIELVANVERKPQNDVRDIMVFSLVKMEKTKLLEDEDSEKENDDFVDMRVASSSTPGALAGAIAAQIREDKKPRITAIGQGPVFKAISAVVIAKKYLQKEEKDVLIYPQFTQVQFENGTEANAMQIIVIPMPDSAAH